MANTKISDLATLAAMDDPLDELPIVDVSDHSMASSGTDKKYLVQPIRDTINLFNVTVLTS